MDTSFTRQGYNIVNDFFIDQDLDGIDDRITNLISCLKEGNENPTETLTRVSKEKSPRFHKIFFAASRSMEMDKVKNQCYEYLKKNFSGNKYINLETTICCSYSENPWTSFEWHQSQSIFPDAKETITFMFPISDSKNFCDQFNWNNGNLESLLPHGRTNYPAKFPSQMKIAEDSVSDLKSSFNLDFKRGDLVIMHPNLLMRLNPTIPGEIMYFGLIRSVALDHLPRNLNKRVYDCEENYGY